MLCTAYDIPHGEPHETSFDNSSPNESANEQPNQSPCDHRTGFFSPHYRRFVDSLNLKPTSRPVTQAPTLSSSQPTTAEVTILSPNSQGGSTPAPTNTGPTSPSSPTSPAASSSNFAIIAGAAAAGVSALALAFFAYRQVRRRQQAAANAAVFNVGKANNASGRSQNTNITSYSNTTPYDAGSPLPYGFTQGVTSSNPAYGGQATFLAMPAYNRPESRPVSTRESWNQVQPQSAMFVTAIYPFVAENPDELDVKAGDRLVLVTQADPDWVVVKNESGLMGLVPMNHLTSGGGPSLPQY